MLIFKKLQLIFICGLIMSSMVGCGEDDSDTDNTTPAGGNNNPTGNGGGNTTGGDGTLADLPKDTGGQHIAKLLGTTDSEMGYYVYLPGGYEDVSDPYPLLVFLHGKSERGDGTNNPEILDKVLKHGPPKLIKNDQWDPTHPMIVVSPQFHSTEGNKNNWGGGDPEYLRNFIKHMIDTYRINESRIYLTGLSHGGNGVYDYLTKQDDALSYIAAAVPVAAYGAKSGVENSRNTPIWVFVGDEDKTNFNTSMDFVLKYNEQSPEPVHPAKISVYNGVGHDVWTRTYSGEGIGTVDQTLDPFDMTIYDWMFQFERE